MQLHELRRCRSRSSCAPLVRIQEHVEKCAAMERQMQLLKEQHATDLGDQQHTFNDKRLCCLPLSVCNDDNDTSHYFTSVGARSIVINPSVCVCLSVLEYISGPIGKKFCTSIPCRRDSVRIWRRCAMLCTSGFMDDVTFGCDGREAGKGWQHSASAINHVRDPGGV